jgi:hypothetical protein
MVTWSRRMLLAGMGSLTLAPVLMSGLAQADMKPAPKGAVVLTVAGAIANANRGGIDPKLDGIFKYHEIRFDKAFAFDRAMLEALPQEEFRAQLPEGHEPATFKGPRLSAVLEMAGAHAGASIKTVALDGYVTELAAGDLDGRDWVLVLERNGRPFGLGGFGPAMLMEKPKSTKVEEGAPWPWALFYVQVEK